MTSWRDLTTEAIVDAGQDEFLNWIDPGVPFVPRGFKAFPFLVPGAPG